METKVCISQQTISDETLVEIACGEGYISAQIEGLHAKSQRILLRCVLAQPEEQRKRSPGSSFYKFLIDQVRSLKPASKFLIIMNRLVYNCKVTMLEAISSSGLMDRSLNVSA